MEGPRDPSLRPRGPILHGRPPAGLGGGGDVKAGAHPPARLQCAVIQPSTVLGLSVAGKALGRCGRTVSQLLWSKAATP